MTERQRQLALALALLSGGALLDHTVFTSLGSANAATAIEVTRACIFSAALVDGGYGIEVCGRAVIPSATDGGEATTVEQGCVNVTNADPALASQVLAAVKASWMTGKGIPLDGGL